MGVFVVRGAILSLVHQFHVACPYHSLHGKRNFSLEIDFYQYELCAHFPHNLPSIEGLQTGCYVETPLILLGVNQHPLGVDPSPLGVVLILPSFRYTGTSFRIDQVLPTNDANCKDRIWDGPKLGLDFNPISPNNEFMENR